MKKIIDKFTKIVFEMYPDAITELEYENDFQLLIAIIMSAQTTDKQVNKVNKSFFEVLKSPLDGVKLGENGIKKYINSIGFYNSKAKNIYKTCQILSKKDLGEFDTLEKLTSLNGVGIKTAKVFLSITRDMPYLAVDTHVHRVLNRVGLLKTKLPEETDKKAEKIFDIKHLSQLHHSLIFFGRYHCTARKPKCDICRLNDICKYYKKSNKN